MNVFNNIPKEPQIVSPTDVVSVELFLTKGDVVQVSVETPIQDFALGCWFSLTPNGPSCHAEPHNQYLIQISNLIPMVIRPRQLPFDIPYGKIFCNIRNRSGDITDMELIVFKDDTTS